MKIELGMKAEDVVTDMAGVVIGHARYITGCDQFLLQPEPKAEDAGRVRPAAEWFDENRLVILEGGALSNAALTIRGISEGLEAAPANAGGADRSAPVK